MGYVGQGDATAHANAGLVLDYHSAKATGGESPGINSPTTTIFSDLSGNSKNGTLTGFAYTTESGWVGDGSIGNPYALVFDGVDDKVAYSNSQTSITDMTLEFWLNVTTDTTWRYVWSSGFWIRYNNTTFSAYLNSQYCNTTINIGGADRHIIVTYSSTSGIKTYIDNVLKTTNATATGVMTLSATTSLMNNGSAVPGKLYIHRKYNKILNVTEIAQNYNAGITWDAGIITPNYYSYIIAH